MATDKTVNLAEIRRLIADYMYSEGCSCCREGKREMADERVKSTHEEVAIDYLKDIRDQLVALNHKLDALTIDLGDYKGKKPALKTFECDGG